MISRLFKNTIGFRTLGPLAALAGLSIFWACHLNEADGKDHFDLKIDATTAQCDSLLVILEDAAGKPIDTLFNDTLVSASQLSNLDVGKYKGGKAQVRILGRKDGGVCIEQTRGFDDQGGKVAIDTLVLPDAAPVSVELDRTLIEITVGDPSVEVKASIKPAFAQQAFEWSIDDASVANVDFPAGQNGGRLRVIPQKNGVANIHVRSKLDPTKAAQLVVRVGSVAGKTVSVSPESLSLFLGGPDTAVVAHVSPEGTDEKVIWSTGDAEVATVDENGKVKSVGAGSTILKAKFGGAIASVAVKVKRDVPMLTVASKSGAAVNDPITYSPKVTQAFGSIILFTWDLQGDGVWDDSLSGPFLGTTVDLPAQTTTYSKQGHFTARFHVRDSEGNEANAAVEIDIGDQPPEILSMSADTLISIKDSVPLNAKAKDLESKVVWMGWDYENDGKFDDSIKGDKSELELKGGHRYNKAGVFSAVLRVEDDSKKVRTDTVKITVELFPPVAKAGNDTTVIAGTPVHFRVLGDDSLGSITKRELKIGAGPYLSLSNSDTTITLPGDSGSVICLARITDDDGNTDEDTMVVTLKVPSLSNNDLAGLAASAGNLAPVFKPVTTLYTLQVPYADSQITLTASTSDPKAEIAVNGKPVASGKPSDAVDVKVGTTQDVFRVVVTAQNGSQKSYAISVTRAPSTDTRLSKLEPAGFGLKPAFAPALLEYADTVAFAASSVSLKPTTSHPAAKVSVNDSVVVSGSSSKDVPLSVGDNLIKVEVTAQDGKAKSVYNVKVVRRAKLILSRIVGAGSPALIDSVEAPLGTTVNLTSKDSVGFHFVKWTVTEGTGTLSDSAANPGKLTLKSGTVRAQGTLEVNVYTIRTGFVGFKGGQFSVDSALVEHGKDTTITITPLTGYRLLALSDNGKEVKTLGNANGLGARTFKVAGVIGNHLLEAAFLRVYTLTTSLTGNGTLAPLGTLTVDSGSSQIIAIASGSPSSGVIISSLMDNEKEQVGGVEGDPMNASKYTLAGIKEDHVIKATFKVKTFTIRVNGHHLCINQVVSCPVGQICPIFLCLSNSGPDTSVFVAEYGSSYRISTDDSLGTRPFLNWNKDGVNAGATTTLTTGPITSDLTYTAVYRSLIIICCPGLCCVIEPPIFLPATSEATPVSTEQIVTPFLQSKETSGEN